MSEIEREALLLSLRVAGLCVAGSLPLALIVAYVLARGRFAGRSVLEAVVQIPLVVPPVVVGYLLLVTFSRGGAVGGWLYDVLGISLAFDWKGAALASAVMGFPLMVRAIRLSLEAVDPKLEAAARTLGAGRARVLATITLPLIVPGIVAGMVLAFARSLGEFGATITFVSNIPGQTQTLPLALYQAVQTPGGEALSMRLTLLSIALALAAVIIAEWLNRAALARIKA